jgi:serine/threonine-protein kinase
VGAVLKAREISAGRIVALKLLPRKGVVNPVTLRRFLREASAVEAMEHPHIVTGYSVGEVEGYHYFAMEYVDGTTLRQRVNDEGKLDEKEIVRIGISISSALDHMHAADILHRDVKPDNILIARDGTHKLVDLGLAKGVPLGSTQLTKEGTVVGTPTFMAPEQARASRDIGSWTDQYSLGCTLYYAATSQVPYRGINPAKVMLRHVKGGMTHPKILRRSLSNGFCAVLANMVALKPQDRYATLGEVVEDLEALLAGKPLKHKAPPPEKSNFGLMGV